MKRDEIKQIYQKVELDTMHMDIDVTHLSEMEQGIKDKKFKENTAELKEFKDHYKEDFLELKRKAELSIQIVENELDYRKQSLIKSLKFVGIDLGIEAESDEDLRDRMLKVRQIGLNNLEKISEKSNESDDDDEEITNIAMNSKKTGGKLQMLRQMSQKKEKFRMNESLSLKSTGVNFRKSGKKRVLKTLPKRKKLSKIGYPPMMKESKSTDISLNTSTTLNSTPSKSKISDNGVPIPGFRLKKLQGKTFNLNAYQHKTKKNFNYSYNVNLLKQQNDDIKKMLGAKRNKKKF